MAKHSPYHYPRNPLKSSHSRSTRVALYARVSALNGQDPEMQLRELREYAGRRGWRSWRVHRSGRLRL